MSSHTQCLRLDSERVTFAITATPGAPPRLLHFGTRLPDAEDLSALMAARASNIRESTPDMDVPASLFPTHGFGWMGESALMCHRGQHQIFPTFETTASRDEENLTISLTDLRNALSITMRFALNQLTNVLRAEATITNLGAPLTIAHLASLTLPLPSTLSDIGAFSGRWGRELQFQQFSAPPGQWAHINRTGRTGFSGASFLVLRPQTDDCDGEAIAFHLAHSSNHKLLVETLNDGTRVAMLRADAPGEVILAHGQSWTTPAAFVAYSADGLNGVRRDFHQHVGRCVAPPEIKTPRPVHFNTWEGVYFDVDEEKLLTLVEAAADLGVERFVIDDGWFKARTNDQSGLGDWTPDPQRFPNGLHAVAARVKERGMGLGLWIEPEMVNTDSDLYRAHPDWILHVEGAPRLTMRNQFTLNLARTDVRNYLFDSISALLRTYPIEYLKWDCNRDAFPAADGLSANSLSQLHGVYTLLDSLRAAFPHVEIEACASGGARHDLAMLSRCTRVWPSDATDPVERMRLMKWASLTTPLAMLGTHVGPNPNPMTGRRTSMDFRCKVSMFGHMGIELNPLTLSPQERQTLTKHIQLYKEQRALLHHGALYEWSGEDGINARMVCDPLKERALLLAVRSDSGVFAESAPLRIPGLSDDASYRLSLIEPVSTRAQRRIGVNSPWRDALTLSGAALAQTGVRLPLIDPMTALLISITRHL